MSAKAVTLRPNTILCELQEVEVLRSADTENPKIGKAQTQQHNVQTNFEDTDRKKEEIPEGIDLEDKCVNDKQKEQLLQFLARWKDRFAKNITNLGNWSDKNMRSN